MLNNLHEPVPQEELQHTRSRSVLRRASRSSSSALTLLTSHRNSHNSNASASGSGYTKPVSSLSFERGSDATRSPTSESGFNLDAGEQTNGGVGASAAGGAAGGRGRSESIGQAVGLAGRERGGVPGVSTSAVSFECSLTLRFGAGHLGLDSEGERRRITADERRS